MIPEFKSTLVKVYLIVGVSVCLFFGTGAIAGWKISQPSMGPGFSGGRSTGGFWGIGK